MNGASGARGPALPVGFRLATLAEQTLGIVVVGIALTVAAQGAWLTGLLEAQLPAAGWSFLGLVLPLTVVLPLVVPILFGLLLALGNGRAPRSVWVGLVVSLAVATVVESDRLNWFAFFSGVSVRLVEGPVPLRRTLFALVTVLAALWVVALASVHRQLMVLAVRGVPPDELRRMRTRLLVHERAVLALAVAGGTMLLVVMRISMGLTEGAPGTRDDAFGPFLFVLLVVAVLVGLLGFLAIRGGPPGGRTRTTGGPPDQ